MLEWAWLLGPLPAIICLISSDENSLIPTFFNTLFSSKLYVLLFQGYVGENDMFDKLRCRLPPHHNKLGPNTQFCIPKSNIALL